MANSDLKQLKLEPKIQGKNEICVQPLTVTETVPSFHWHDYYTVDLVLHGRGTHYVGTKKYRIDKGSFYLVHPTDIHALVCDEGTPLCVLGILFPESAVPEELRPLLDRSPKSGADVQVSAFLENYARTIEFYQRKTTRSAKEIVRQNFALFLRVFADCVSPGGFTGSGEEARITRAMRFLDLHFREDPSAETVAAQVGFSTAYFSSWFAKNTGQSYTEYLNARKAAYARSLLEMDLSITEICFASGFGSISRFNDVFRKTFGCSPRAYRKNQNIR